MRSFNTKSDGKSFDESLIEAVWRKGTPEPDFANFRKDVCVASMQGQKYGTQEQWDVKLTTLGLYQRADLTTKKLTPEYFNSQ